MIIKESVLRDFVKRLVLEQAPSNTGNAEEESDVELINASWYQYNPKSDVFSARDFRKKEDPYTYQVDWDSIKSSKGDSLTQLKINIPEKAGKPFNRSFNVKTGGAVDRAVGNLLADIEVVYLTKYPNQPVQANHKASSELSTQELKNAFAEFLNDMREVSGVKKSKLQKDDSRPKKDKQKVFTRIKDLTKKERKSLSDKSAQEIGQDSVIKAMKFSRSSNEDPKFESNTGFVIIPGDITVTLPFEDKPNAQLKFKYEKLSDGPVSFKLLQGLDGKLDFEAQKAGIKKDAKLLASSKNLKTDVDSPITKLTKQVSAGSGYSKYETYGTLSEVELYWIVLKILSTILS